LTEATEAVSELRTLVKAHPDNEEIMCNFAGGISNLTEKQDADGIAQSVEEIRALTQFYA
jgi:succinyl-CoA synthetase beta subunit